MTNETYEMLQGHETILRGTAQEPGGLIQRVDRVQQVVKFQTKLAWIILAAAVASIIRGEQRVETVVQAVQAVQAQVAHQDAK